jgi:hypothetical protein
MPGPLKPAENHHRHQVPDVQAIGRRVEAGVERPRLSIEPSGKPGVVGRLMDHAAAAKIGEDVHKEMGNGECGMGSRDIGVAE